MQEEASIDKCEDSISSSQITVSDGVETIDESILVEIVEQTVDQPPEFFRDRYSFAINEDDEDGTELGELRVTDAGEGPFIVYLKASESIP